MTLAQTSLCHGLAILTGVMAWVGLLVITGLASGNVAGMLRREAWDLEVWWVTSLPLTYLMAGVLGWLGPRRIWRWPLTIIGTQFACGLVLARSGLSLLPVALVFMLVLSLPGLLTASLGRTLARLYRKPAESR